MPNTVSEAQAEAKGGVGRSMKRQDRPDVGIPAKSCQAVKGCGWWSDKRVTAGSDDVIARTHFQGTPLCRGSSVLWLHLIRHQLTKWSLRDRLCSILRLVPTSIVNRE
jgi:hypothetical protein